MKSLFVLVAFALSFHMPAHADQRFDYYCVTTPTQEKAVFVYDDLIESYADEYKYIPFTYLKDVDFHLLKEAPSENYTLREVKAKTDTLTHYRNNDSGGSYEQDGVKYIQSGRIVEATRPSHSSRSAITITIKDYPSNTVLFQIPFVTHPDKRTKIKTPGLIFNGKLVDSVTYQPCQSDAD